MPWEAGQRFIYRAASYLSSINVQAQEVHVPQRDMVATSDNVAALSMALTVWYEHLEAADQLLGRAASEFQCVATPQGQFSLASCRGGTTSLRACTCTIRPFLLGMVPHKDEALWQLDAAGHLAPGKPVHQTVC